MSEGGWPGGSTAQEVKDMSEFVSGALVGMFLWPVLAGVLWRIRRRRSDRQMDARWLAARLGKGR